jgi:hypothetical protein
MQHILFAAAKKWFTPQRGTSASLPADTADGKIETFVFASLDVRRERVMLWKRRMLIRALAYRVFTAHE